MKILRPAILLFFLFTQIVQIHAQSFLPAAKVAADFKTMLERPHVAFRPSFTSTHTDSVTIEKGFIYTQANEKMPVLIYKPFKAGVKTFPVVICLHGTGGNKEGMEEFLMKLSKAGFMAVAIDARYHGERISGGAHGSNEYAAAITKAWQNKDTAHQEHPFLYDTVYDLWRLTDYLITRSDVNAARIGMTGVSMGGIETWMAASVDPRIKVIVPIIAAQSFSWSLENNKWQGRAATIQTVHQEAAKDLGDAAVNKENVKKVWDKILPGITGEFDCPSMIRLFAPRPLLVLNNEKDPNCPLPGALLAFDAATQAYRSKNALDKLKTDVTPNEPHRLTPRHVTMTVDWFVKWL
jgi:dienelactone hydrolase